MVLSPTSGRATYPIPFRLPSPEPQPQPGFTYTGPLIGAEPASALPDLPEGVTFRARPTIPGEYRIDPLPPF